MKTVLVTLALHLPELIVRVPLDVPEDADDELVRAVLEHTLEATNESPVDGASFGEAVYYQIMTAPIVDLEHEYIEYEDLS